MSDSQPPTRVPAGATSVDRELLLQDPPLYRGARCVVISGRRWLRFTANKLGIHPTPDAVDQPEPRRRRDVGLRQHVFIDRAFVEQLGAECTREQSAAKRGRVAQAID